MPRLRQLQQNLRPLPAFNGSDVIVSSGGGDRLLLGRALHDLESEHNSRRNVSKILDLASVVGLALERKIHWEASVNEGAPNAIPLNDRLVGLEMVARDERPCTILVDVGDMVVNQHPMGLLQRHAVWLLRWLTRPPDGMPYVVEAVT